MNSIHVIHPYLDGGALVFDDPAVGLFREPLVGGTDLILQVAARDVDADPDCFTLIFSDIPFPGHQAVATWIEPGEMGFGDWYAVKIPGVIEGNGWLCPALLKYFPKAPAQIFFQTKPFKKEMP